MTMIIQLNCAHCGEGIDIVEPFQKLNTGLIQCPSCQSFNTLLIEDEHSEDGPLFYLEMGS